MIYKMKVDEKIAKEAGLKMTDLGANPSHKKTPETKPEAPGSLPFGNVIAFTGKANDDAQKSIRSAFRDHLMELWGIVFIPYIRKFIGMAAKQKSGMVAVLLEFNDDQLFNDPMMDEDWIHFEVTSNEIFSEDTELEIQLLIEEMIGQGINFGLGKIIYIKDATKLNQGMTDGVLQVEFVLTCTMSNGFIHCIPKFTINGASQFKAHDDFGNLLTFGASQEVGAVGLECSIHNHVMIKHVQDNLQSLIHACLIKP